MSVNEVKLTRALPFAVRGSGPPNNRTFAIGNEDHTLGNALRHVLIHNSKVDFAGYSVPHPSEPIVHIRVQTHDEPTTTTAIEALQESCDTLYRQCDYVLAKIEEKLPEITTDRTQLEEKIRAMQAYDDDDDEDGEEGGGDNDVEMMEGEQDVDWV